MNIRSLCAALVATAAVPVAAPAKDWAIHDLTRPVPPVVDPGSGTPAAEPGKPPADAVVLFDGRDLSAWKSSKDGGAAPWKVEKGYFEVVGGSGGIETKQGFGDVQLHVEFMTPTPPTGESQGRGNSGIFPMGLYEVQLLDSYQNTTYADGQAGAIYGQFPPLVNAARPPGEWQAYDIVFERPRWDEGGKLTKPARVTVLHNGVLVQHATEPTGPTGHKVRPPYVKHADRLPLALQDHGNPIRFRNVWLRELQLERP